MPLILCTLIFRITLHPINFYRTNYFSRTKTRITDHNRFTAVFAKKSLIFNPFRFMFMVMHLLVNCTWNCAAIHAYELFSIQSYWLKSIFAVIFKVRLVHFRSIHTFGVLAWTDLRSIQSVYIGLKRTDQI